MTETLVGRDAERAALRHAIKAATGAGAAGGPVVILVAGDAGAGKTTLAGQVLTQAGARVLCGRAAEWAGTAYDALARALRPAVGPGHPERDVLAQVMPELGAPGSGAGRAVPR